MTSSIPAVVLAGGKNKKAMKAATGIENRALVVLGGRTMLDYVVEALHAAQLAALYVVGDVPQSDRYTQIQGGETLMDNLLAGLDRTAEKGAGPVLICTSDIPFLNAEAVNHFIGLAAPLGADFCYSVVPISACLSKYPDMKRTTLRLKEGTFTGGNLMLVNPGFVRANRSLVSRAYDARKSVFKLGALLGWSLLARIVASQTVSPSLLSVAHLERGAGRLLGGTARAVVSPFAEIGTDIDKPEDLDAASRILEKIS